MTLPRSSRWGIVSDRKQGNRRERNTRGLRVISPHYQESISTINREVGILKRKYSRRRRWGQFGAYLS